MTMSGKRPTSLLLLKWLRLNQKRRSLRLGREGRVDSGGTHEVEVEGSLGDQGIPDMKGRIRVTTAESGNEMILVGLDGSLG